MSDSSLLAVLSEEDGPFNDTSISARFIGAHPLYNSVVMGTSSTVHPSQQRLSCDICRRHKTRCQRIKQSDPKCARCTMLDEECITSEQKKVGRPRKLDSASGQRSRKESTQRKRAKPTTEPRKNQVNRTRQSGSSHSSASPDSGIFLDPEDQSSTARSTFSATALTTAPPVESTTNDMFTYGSSWPATWSSGVQIPLMSSSPWDLASPFKLGFAYPDYDWNFGESDVVDTSDVIDKDSSRTEGVVFCSEPEKLVIPALGVAVGSIELSDALSKLSKMNIDLHSRLAAMEAHRSAVDLNSILFREGPFFIDNLTLGEFTMKTTQELFDVLSRLLNNRDCHPPLNNYRDMDAMSLSGPEAQSSEQPYGERANGTTPNFDSSFPSASPRPLLSPLALTITAVYTQLVTLYEVLVHHMLLRLETIDTNPVAPVPGSMFSEFLLQEPCAMGIRFSSISINLLDRVEQILGINGRPEWGGTGLMSIRQIDVLWGELDSGKGVAPGHGFMRPAYVKRLLRKTKSKLELIAPR